jgi:hypothetical protein
MRRYGRQVTEVDYLIAGLRVRLDDDCDTATRAELAARLPEFQIPRAGEPEVILSAQPCDGFVDLSLSDKGVLTSRERDGNGGETIRIRRTDFDGTWCSARRRATCRYTAPFPSLNAFFRIVCSYALLEKGGLLLHASSVVSGGRAFAFVGHSGAGKTTMARLAAPRPVLSDEVTALRPRARGGASSSPPAFDCFPTPFWGDMERVRAGSAAPLALIGFPVHAESGEPRLRKASEADAFSQLLHCVFAFDLSGNEKASVLEAAAAILRAVSCVYVEYPLDRPPWDLLDAFPASS